MHSVRLRAPATRPDLSRRRLLYLSRIGQLELLRLLYHQVFIAATVWHEAVMARSNAPGVDALLGASWLVVSDRAEHAGVGHELRDALDPGEGQR